ncbi:MAG TPA: hypothetical protein VMT68_17130 [Caulobacteraceae bacterium]|nr:hypothetical protein [Caulobacteraceae bacterium]
MPLVRTALMATAACLISATAYAQTASDPPTSPQTSPDTTATAPDAPPPSDMNGQGAAPTGSPANASATVAGGVQVVASQPVPDTPANRAAFGQPLSRAGKRTKPAGD